MKAAPDPETEVAFFPTAGGMVAPTVFTPNTTPRLMAAARSAFEETIAEVQAELIVVAFSIVAGALGRYALKRLQRAKPPTPQGKPGSKPPAPKPSATAKPAATTKRPTRRRRSRSPSPRSRRRRQRRGVASDEVSVSLLKPAPQGPAAEYGTQLGTRLKTDGKVGYKALKPIAQDLSVKTDLSPAQKADAAKNAVDVSRPTFGAGPVVEMNGYHVVTSRLPGAATDVMVVKPDGRRLRQRVGPGRPQPHMVREGPPDHKP